MGRMDKIQHLNMRTFRERCKDILVRTVAFILFHSGVLKQINRIGNNFQPKKSEKGILAFPFIQKRTSRNVQILMYHRVNDDYDPFFPATPITVFAQQMEYLASHFTIFPLEEAVERMKRKDVPENAVVVTFDDGYQDNYLHAFPVLKGLSIPAAIFLATDAIGSGRVLWHDRVFSAFRETQVPFLQGLGDNPTVYPLKTLEDKFFAQGEVLKFLRSLGDRECSFWIDNLVERLEVPDAREAPDLMLAWDEVRIMHRSGMSFGSHTVSHPILSQVSPERAREEIYESKRIIEENIGTAVTTFAYPSGRKQDFNGTTKAILKEAGYTCALTVVFGTNGSGQDPFELCRATPWEEDICTFGMKLHYYKLFS